MEGFLISILQKQLGMLLWVDIFSYTFYLREVYGANMFETLNNISILLVWSVGLGLFALPSCSWYHRESKVGQKESKTHAS